MYDMAAIALGSSLPFAWVHVISLCVDSGPSFYFHRAGSGLHRTGNLKPGRGRGECRLTAAGSIHVQSIGWHCADARRFGIWSNGKSIRPGSRALRC